MDFLPYKQFPLLSQLDKIRCNFLSLFQVSSLSLCFLVDFMNFLSLFFVPRPSFPISRWFLLSVLNYRPSPACPHPPTITPPLPILDVVVQGESIPIMSILLSQSGLLLSFWKASQKPWFHGDLLVSPGTAQPRTVHIIIFTRRGNSFPRPEKPQRRQRRNTDFNIHIWEGHRPLGTWAPDLDVPRSLLLCVWIAGGHLGPALLLLPGGPWSQSLLFRVFCRLSSSASCSFS